jgi:hypothetical protein
MESAAAAAPAPHQRRKRGKRKCHTIRGLLERDPSTLTWQQKLELEDLQRKRAHLSSGGAPGKRARTGDDDGEAPPTPNHTTAVRSAGIRDGPSLRARHLTTPPAPPRTTGNI